MTDEEKQSNLSDSNQTNNELGEYIKQVIPFLAVAIFTFVTYCLGWAYASGFFARLGISLDSLHLPNIYFLRKAAIPTILSTIIIWLYYSITARLSAKRKIINRFLEKLVILSLLTSSVLIFFIDNPLFIEVIHFIQVLSIYTISSLKLDVYLEKYIKNKFTYYFVSISYFFIYLIVLLYINGKINAVYLIENSKIVITNTYLGVKVKTKVSLQNNLNNKNLVFVMHTNDNYYLVEQEKPAPRKPKVYIIPEDNVEFIEQERVK